MSDYSFEEVEAWLKDNRSRWDDETKGFHDFQSPYWTYDVLLDDLRLHGVQGIPLTEHACEGGCPECSDFLPRQSRITGALDGDPDLAERSCDLQPRWVQGIPLYEDDL